MTIEAAEVSYPPTTRLWSNILRPLGYYGGLFGIALGCWLGENVLEKNPQIVSMALRRVGIACEYYPEPHSEVFGVYCVYKSHNVHAIRINNKYALGVRLFGKFYHKVGEVSP
jgi:hypothetical protein